MCHRNGREEAQGHGRTAGTDRDIELRYLASDVAGLLDHLGVGRADVFGFSLGGGTAPGTTRMGVLRRTSLIHPLVEEFLGE